VLIKISYEFLEEESTLRSQWFTIRIRFFVGSVFHHNQTGGSAEKCGLSGGLDLTRACPPCTSSTWIPCSSTERRLCFIVGNGKIGLFVSFEMFFASLVHGLGALERKCPSARSSGTGRDGSGPAGHNERTSSRRECKIAALHPSRGNFFPPWGRKEVLPRYFERRQISFEKLFRVACFLSLDAPKTP